jgi:hypothetical protein
MIRFNGKDALAQHAARTSTDSPRPRQSHPEGHRQTDRRDRATLRIVTFNDDFVDRKTSLPNIHGGVVMVQEAKNVDVHQVVDQREYDVFQNREDAAHAGSAMYWRQERFRVLDNGQRLLAKRDAGDDMLDRHLTWTDLKVRGKDVKVRMASAHRPPGDEKDEWPEFDRNLAAFAKQARHDHVPVVIGMDANFPSKDRAAAIRRLERITGLQWHGPKGSIDGFLASKNVRFVEAPHKEKERLSDHDPVAARIVVLETRKK